MNASRSCEACGASVAHRRRDARFCDEGCAKRTPCRGCGSLERRKPGGHYCFTCRKPSPGDLEKVLVVKRCCGKTVETPRNLYLDTRSTDCQKCANTRNTSRRYDVPPLAERKCVRCGLILATESFPRTKTGRPGTVCVGCKSSYHHDRRLVETYGISPEIYAALLVQQEGRCAICRRKPGKKRLAVDHDHACCGAKTSCGKCVRGLLCTRCNSGVLGHLHDDIEALERAIMYLKNPPGGGVVTDAPPTTSEGDSK